MSDDWQKRYDAAQAEMKAAHLQWNKAEKELARATARQNKAEREFRRVFLERTNNLSGADVGSVGESK